MGVLQGIPGDDQVAVSFQDRMIRVLPGSLCRKTVVLYSTDTCCSNALQMEHRFSFLRFYMKVTPH